MRIGISPPLAKRRLFRLQTILLCLMLMVLALPLGGLYFFRIYENELVQQTERELIAQAAALSASYRQLLRTLDQGGEPYGKLLSGKTQLAYGASESPPNYEPIFPALSLLNPIEGPRPNAQPAIKPASTLAEKAGRLLRPVLAETQHITLSGIRLLDADGTVIAGREEIGQSLAHLPEIQAAMDGRYVSLIRQRLSDQPPPPLYSISRGTNIRVFVAFPIIEQGRLQGVFYLSRTPNNILKHLYEARSRVFLAAISLLLIVVIIAILVSGAIARPIRELIRRTEKLRSGEHKTIEPLENPVTFEIARLSESFADVSKALAEKNDYIRRFATHVSHEFKTPLTSMQGALELLQDHFDTMPEDRRRQFMANLTADTQRLKQLVNRLLELAHADAAEPTGQSCRLDAILGQLRQRFGDKGLAIELMAECSRPLPMASEALEMILANLCENSLQHSADQLQINPQENAEGLLISVRDNGRGISKENRNKIFMPFFTTRRGNGGTGLGLEICASLLKAYGGEIALGESDSGAEFILRLPSL